MKLLDLNGVSILWQRIKTMFARKNETVSNISRNNTTFTATRADGTTFTFDQKDTTYNNATTSTAGLMSATDKAKLNSIENGAQENILESVSINGTKQTAINKGIDITIPTAVSDLNNDLGYLADESDPTVPLWAKQAQKPVYTASEVGALSADTKIPTKVSDLTDDSGHYTKPSGGIPSTDLSSDILTVLEKADTVVQDVSDVQDAVAELTDKLNALADSDDTTLDQMSEIVAYIKNNKSLIDGITTDKVSVADIVDNLTSTAANKPLSAKQGKVLKDLIDGIVIPTNVSAFTNDVGYLTQHQDISGKANISDLSTVATSGSYDDLTNKPNIPTVPTNVSAFINDAGYLTQHQDISGKQDIIADLATIRSGASLGATALQEETDPTVPAWAKASTKPTYTASEVGALPDDTIIPSKTSDLTNDSNFVTDEEYVHTDNNYTNAEKSKLSGIASGAEVNVNADWNAVSGDAQIINKPTNVSAFNNDVGYLTQHQDISGKANTADLAAVATSGSYNDLSNKPTIPTVPTNVSAFNNDASYADEQYVDDAITAALADMTGIEYHVCTAQEYNAQTYIPTLQGEVGVIYLVPKPAEYVGSATVGSSSVSGNNIYYEFIYNGQSFEMIGDTQVSLDGYIEESDIATNNDIQTVLTEVFGGG